MRIQPWILGSLALAPAVGALAGQQINTDPIGPAADLSATLPERPVIAASNADPRTQPRLPDHYAMETPEGIVEVHELAMRGRYRDRYDAAQEYQAVVEQDIAAMEARWESAAKVEEQTQTIHTAQQQPPHGAKVRQTAAHEVADGVIQIETAEPAVASPRVIDVSAQLALRE